MSKHLLYIFSFVCQGRGHYRELAVFLIWKSRTQFLAVHNCSMITSIDFNSVHFLTHSSLETQNMISWSSLLKIYLCPKSKYPYHQLLHSSARSITSKNATIIKCLSLIFLGFGLYFIEIDLISFRLWFISSTIINVPLFLSFRVLRIDARDNLQSVVFIFLLLRVRFSFYVFAISSRITFFTSHLFLHLFKAAALYLFNQKTKEKRNVNHKSITIYIDIKKHKPVTLI